MKKKAMYIVAWHEENESGSPVHAMGAEAFDTESAARRWIDASTAEDRARHETSELSDADFVDETVDDGVVHTYGNGQHCTYRVVRIEREDFAAEMVDELKAAFKRQAHPAAKAVVAEEIVRSYERRLLPTKRYSVDVTFTPTVCIHGVEATSPEDAVEAVNRMVDDRTLRVDPAQLTDGILENCEYVGNAQEEEAE